MVKLLLFKATLRDPHYYQSGISLVNSFDFNCFQWSYALVKQNHCFIPFDWAFLTVVSFVTGFCDGGFVSCVCFLRSTAAGERSSSETVKILVLCKLGLPIFKISESDEPSKNPLSLVFLWGLILLKWSFNHKLPKDLFIISFCLHFRRYKCSFI